MYQYQITEDHITQKIVRIPIVSVFLISEFHHTSPLCFSRKINIRLVPSPEITSMRQRQPSLFVLFISIIYGYTFLSYLVHHRLEPYIKIPSHIVHKSFHDL